MLDPKKKPNDKKKIDKKEIEQQPIILSDTELIELGNQLKEL